MTRAGSTAHDPADGELVPAAEFAVRDFARTAVGSHRATIDVADYESQPLDADTLDLVDYLARLEHSTLSHLRSVLVPPTRTPASPPSSSPGPTRSTGSRTRSRPCARRTRTTRRVRTADRAPS
jgi:hypothetical protein